MQKAYYVYILASQRNGTLYIGMTNDLAGVSTNTAQALSRASRRSMASRRWSITKPSAMCVTPSTAKPA